MRNRTFGVLLSILLLANSCTTTLVSSKKQNPVDQVIKNGDRYIFYTEDGIKEKIKVESINETQVMGKNAAGQNVVINKNEISQIKKENTLGTIGIAAGVVAVAVLLPAYMTNL